MQYAINVFCIHNEIMQHNYFVRMMLLEENQIAFHNDDGLIFDGVKDYARQIAEMIGLGSDSDFPQAGVSL